MTATAFVLVLMKRQIGIKLIKGDLNKISQLENHLHDVTEPDIVFLFCRNNVSLALSLLDGTGKLHGIAYTISEQETAEFAVEMANLLIDNPVFRAIVSKLTGHEISEEDELAIVEDLLIGGFHEN